MHGINHLEVMLFGICVIFCLFVALPRLFSYIRKDILEKNKQCQVVEKEIEKLEYDLEKLKKVQFIFTPPVDDLSFEYDKALTKVKHEAIDDLEMKARCLRYTAKRVFINKIKSEVMKKLSQERFIELCLKDCAEKMRAKN